MSVPPRWLECPRKGQLIAGKFFPFKTPLGPRYDSEVPEECRFKPDMLVGYIAALGLRVGVVIDLTKTDRFYDKRELLEQGIGHYKLKCEGFGETPTPEQVKEFKKFCSHFIETRPGEIIGIHCTHGYNRTGFLIISYLVEAEDWSLEAAVNAFITARPPGIYKEHYLRELANRYAGGSVADIPFPPVLPEWCREGGGGGGGGGDGEDGGGRDGGRGTRGGRGGRGRRRFVEVQKEFMDGKVQGVEMVASSLREQIEERCQEILQWERAGFPGSQPVSMDVQNIGLLNQHPYRVSWKADGTRFLMYVKGRHEVYLMDRDNTVFCAADICFLARKRPGEHITDTLVDGEMVMDKTPNGIRPRFLIYDVMQFEGSVDVSHCDHQRRLFCVEKELIGPREAAFANGSLNKQSESFGVRAKQFWDVSETRFVLEKFCPKLTHETDGLIFSPSKQPYTTGQDNMVLKWKPADLNTVDFKLNIVTVQSEGSLPEKVGQLFVGGMQVPFSSIDLKKNKKAKECDGKIIECYWDQAVGWNFMRVRTDKSHPNSYTTASSVCNSIKQPVTRDWLLEVINKHRWRSPLPGSVHLSTKRPPPAAENGEDRALMPPPSSRPRLDSS